MLKRITLTWLNCRLLFILPFGATLVHAGNTANNNYETGYAAIVKLTADLYQALGPKQRHLLLSVPVFLENVTTPYLQPGEYFDGSNTWRAVHISEGLIALLNNISHAKAIDGVDRGFLKKYAASLASEAGNQPLAELSNVTHKKSWAFDTMNHQVSHFNQMAGALIAIDLAHHYLGHYNKYASQLVDAQNRPVPINTLLTPAEWREAVLWGARNALGCGLGTEGLRAIYDCLDKMPIQPAWVVYLRPPQANLSKIKKELNELEKDFFLVDGSANDKFQRFDKDF